MARKRVDRGGPTVATSARQLAREARVARALREVAGALGASLELDELLELVLGKLTELLDADRAILFLLDERKRELVSRSASVDEDYTLRLPLGDGLLSYVARAGRSVRVDDFSKSEHKSEWDDALGIQTRSAVVAPLKNNLSRTIGVLLAFDELGGQAFDDDDEEILSVLAKQAAIAIDNSRLLVTLIRKNQQLQQAQVQLTRRVRDLELLFELERNTAHAVSLEDLARAVLESLARACNASGAVLVLAAEGDEGFVEFTLRRFLRDVGEVQEPPAEFATSVYSPAEGVLGPVIQYSSPIQLDAATEPLNQPGLPQVDSMIAEPLEASDTPLGALALVNKRGGPFTAEDLGLLRLVSANVSTAVRLFNANRARERGERLTSIGRLLSQVVHDLKSPLTVISGYVQLMEETSSRKERARFAEEILKQFQALGAMQQEVLAFARGETQVFTRRVIVDRFFEGLGKQLRTELEGMKVDLKLVATRKLVAYFDSERMTRALQNLARNAAEAMVERGGTITIQAEEDDDGALLFRVSDTGPGIPPEIAPRLFQSFVTAGKKDGTGLGLAIVKRIVEEHGGSIALCDIPKGACFVMKLPQRGAIGKPSGIDEEPTSTSAEVNKTSPSAPGKSRKPAAVARKPAKPSQRTPASRASRTSERAVSEKAVPKKAAPKKATAKKTPVRKAAAKKAASRKATAKKTPVRKAAAKKASARKASAKKGAIKKSSSSKVSRNRLAAGKAAAKTTARKTASGKAPPRRASGRTVRGQRGGR